MAGIDVASGTVVLAVGPALTGLWRVGLVILVNGSVVHWFVGSMVQWEFGQAERGRTRIWKVRAVPLFDNNKCFG